MTSAKRFSVRGLLKMNRTALVVVDMQNDYCSGRGALAMSGMDVSNMERRAPKIASFLESCRKLGIFIVHTRMTHSSFTDTPSWKRRSGGLPIARENSWGSRRYDKLPALEPRPGEYVITKHRYSAFLNTGLEQVLRAKAISTVLFAGATTNVCVECTARDAAMLDFNVVLVKDCTATYDDVLQSASETNIQNHFGFVLSSSEILKLWEIKNAKR